MFGLWYLFIHATDPRLSGLRWPRLTHQPKLTAISRSAPLSIHVHLEKCHFCNKSQEGVLGKLNERLSIVIALAVITPDALQYVTVQN